MLTFIVFCCQLRLGSTKVLKILRWSLLMNLPSTQLECIVEHRCHILYMLYLFLIISFKYLNKPLTSVDNFIPRIH